MDNRIFNVNGSTKEELIAAISLATMTTGGYKIKCVAVNPKKGIVLYGYSPDKDIQTLPVPIAPDVAATIVWDWLQTSEAKTIPHEGWDVNKKHDGHNSIGWRAYVENWGHVDGKWGAIVAIKPAYLWHGK